VTLVAVALCTDATSSFVERSEIPALEHPAAMPASAPSSHIGPSSTVLAHPVPSFGAIHTAKPIRSGSCPGEAQAPACAVTSHGGGGATRSVLSGYWNEVPLALSVELMGMK